MAAILFLCISNAEKLTLLGFINHDSLLDIFNISVVYTTFCRLLEGEMVVFSDAIMTAWGLTRSDPPKIFTAKFNLLKIYNIIGGSLDLNGKRPAKAALPISI
jgi:hypothetical protein